MSTHTYATQLSWSGSTAPGYDGYERAHTVVVPGATTLALSADPAFRGDPSLANPEQLLLAALSSCQLLSFLAVAARARLDVVAYTDEATAVMPDEPQPARVTSVTLRPHIVLGATTSRDVAHLVQVAHRECFIANSVNSEVTVEPTIVMPS